MEDIQADFDPESYDETMKKVFNEDYYEEEEGGEEAKPVFSDLEEGEEGEGPPCTPWKVGVPGVQCGGSASRVQLGGSQVCSVAA